MQLPFRSPFDCSHSFLFPKDNFAQIEAHGKGVDREQSETMEFIGVISDLIDVVARDHIALTEANKDDRCIAIRELRLILFTHLRIYRLTDDRSKIS